MGKSYRADNTIVRNSLRRNSQEEEFQARRFGYFTYDRFAYVYIDDIDYRPVWQESKLDRIRQAMRQGRPLPPVRLVRSGRRYKITDGIHRIEVSKEFGFDLVPALVQETQDVRDPESYFRRRFASKIASLYLETTHKSE